MDLNIERNDRGNKCIVQLVEDGEMGERAVVTMELEREWVESHNPAEIQSTLRTMGRELYDGGLGETITGP